MKIEASCEKKYVRLDSSMRIENGLRTVHLLFDLGHSDHQFTCSIIVPLSFLLPGSLGHICHNNISGHVPNGALRH
jgi:hypothetical protein